MVSDKRYLVFDKIIDGVMLVQHSQSSSFLQFQKWTLLCPFNVMPTFASVSVGS